jgi:hypothetical protein
VGRLGGNPTHGNPKRSLQITSPYLITNKIKHAYYFQLLDFMQVYNIFFLDKFRKDPINLLDRQINDPKPLINILSHDK